MSVSAATLLLPDPDATWRVWKPRAATPSGEVHSPADFTDQSKPVIIGLPASACRSIGLILPQADDAVLEQMILAQLEKRGIKPSSPDTANYRWHLLGASGPMAILSIDVLADPFPEALAVAHAANYTSALRLAQLPEGHLVILEEQGDLVLAAGHHGKLFHSHIFGQAPGSADEIALEVALSKLSLEGQQGSSLITGITLVGKWDLNQAAALEAATGLKTQVTPHLPKNPDLDSRSWTRLLPASVYEIQSGKSRRKKYLRYALMAAGLYSALAFLGYAYLNNQERTADRLATEVEATAPAAAEVKRTAERWKALAPAIETNRYPLVQLNDVTSLMPPSGIVIREFEAKMTEIDIRGEARDAQTAFQFLEDIKKHRNLGRYDWSMPQPSVKEKTAAFRAQGKLKA